MLPTLIPRPLHHFQPPWRQPPASHLEEPPGLNDIHYLTLSSVPLICRAAFCLPLWELIHVGFPGCHALNPQAISTIQQWLENQQKGEMASSLCATSRGSPTAELFMSRHVMGFSIIVACVDTQKTSLSPQWTNHREGGSVRMGVPAAKLYSESCSPHTGTGRCLPLGEFFLGGLPMSWETSQVLCS